MSCLRRHPKKQLSSGSPYPAPAPDRESLAQKKRREQLELSELVDLFGISMVPCFSCEASGTRCRLDSERSTRCSECIRLRKACNAVVPLEVSWETEVPRESDWKKIREQKEKLEEEEEEAIQRSLKAN